VNYPAHRTGYSAVGFHKRQKNCKFVLTKEVIAKVLKREEFVIPTKVGHAVKYSTILSFQYVAIISG